MRDQEDGEPAHHARRPMNAFLIFCKRHRSVVREKYPNLENRSITKILGEWWANLEKEDKACYTGLAKQYKDAFFNANPDFKWYKLPAPPLRAARRDPPDPDHDLAEADPPDTQRPIETTNNNSTKLDFNKNLNDDLCAGERPMFTPGKLADEAQMGGLSSLLAAKTEAKKSNPQLALPFQFHTYANTNDVPHMRLAKATIRSNDNIRELQNALTETTRMFEDYDGSRGVHVTNPNEKITNQDVIDQIVDNRFSKEDDYGYNKHWSDDEKNPKSKRSCKGKKYQEFMAVGGFIVNKRQKRDHPEKIGEEEYNASCSWEEAAPRARSPPHALPKHEADTKAEPDAADAPDADANISKAFKASDFDLDAKIKALPSLSLEKFQQRKRDNKRKKKTINLKPMLDEPRYISFAREAVIGSQKRKPRKISITRLEINSLISAVELTEAAAMAGAGSGAGECGRSAEGACGALGYGGSAAAAAAAAAHGSPDLLALATLAEVAANTSKLDGAALL